MPLRRGNVSTSAGGSTVSADASDVTLSRPLRTSYGYTGRELDCESKLKYYRARYYDPLIGRFLQKDPNPGNRG
jgi:RHS repeat-associated protein